MKKRIASVVLVSAMGIGTVSGLALSPVFAATQEATSERLTHIKNALKGLVSDGTLTQTQADKVATTLDQSLPRGGPGRMRHHLLHDAAGILGMTVEQLRTAMGTDKSLADIAATKGISRDTLIDRLAAVIEKRLAEQVKAGHLTQAQADARKAEIKQKLAQAVDRVGLPQRPERGDRPQGPPAEGSPAEPSSTT